MRDKLQVFKLFLSQVYHIYIIFYILQYIYDSTIILCYSSKALQTSFQSLQNPAACNKELEIFMDHAGRNCVLIEYVSNTSMDKLNDFHFMQLIKINYWLFDDDTHSGLRFFHQKGGVESFYCICV